MRIDLRTQPIDPRWNQYNVFLDDVQLRYCFMADEEAGIALCNQADPQGGLLCDAQGVPLEVTHHGRVELRQGQP